MRHPWIFVSVTLLVASISTASFAAKMTDAELDNVTAGANIDNLGHHNWELQPCGCQNAYYNPGTHAGPTSNPNSANAGGFGNNKIWLNNTPGNGFPGTR